MGRLTPGDGVSAGRELAIKGGVVPVGRRGVVESVDAAASGELVGARFPSS